jgi:hypothetical protein|tara:strand:- start:1245 stop:1745 length:501 start_codon:yes stop_codon:yes gene_type:complete
LESLDCVTPAGKKWVSRQSSVVQIISEAWNLDAIETSKTSSATIDVLFSRSGILKAVAEIKCRDMDYAQLQRYGSYLITEDKLIRGYRVAASLHAPLFLFVGLRGDQRIVYCQLTDELGVPVGVTIERRSSLTKRTCNDHSGVERMNAYIPVEHMRELKHSGGISW